MENEAFAPKEQMLRFPLYFQIHDISKGVKRRYFLASRLIRLSPYSNLLSANV